MLSLTDDGSEKGNRGLAPWVDRECRQIAVLRCRRPGLERTGQVFQVPYQGRGGWQQRMGTVERDTERQDGQLVDDRGCVVGHYVLGAGPQVQ
jgi:hypothetical protein